MWASAPRLPAESSRCRASAIGRARRPAYYSTGGINLTGGCFSVAGTCIGGGGGTNYWTSSGGNIYNNTGTNVGIGTTTPGSLLSLYNIANFTAATSTFYGTGGINLKGGCFSINGACISGGVGTSYIFYIPSSIPPIRFPRHGAPQPRTSGASSRPSPVRRWNPAMTALVQRPGGVALIPHLFPAGTSGARRRGSRGERGNRELPP